MADMPMKADYDRIAADWIRARQALPPLDQTLIESFIEQLPPGARVLDLGCGTGRPIAMLLARHALPVHGVDRSAALLAEAQRNVARQRSSRPNSRTTRFPAPGRASSASTPSSTCRARPTNPCCGGSSALSIRVACCC
jgi:SAM-dependent methyltransferase